MPVLFTDNLPPFLFISGILAPYCSTCPFLAILARFGPRETVCALITPPSQSPNPMSRAQHFFCENALRFTSTAAQGFSFGCSSRPRWHFLYFLPEPHQHGAFLSRPFIVRLSCDRDMPLSAGVIVIGPSAQIAEIPAMRGSRQVWLGAIVALPSMVARDRNGYWNGPPRKTVNLLKKPLSSCFNPAVSVVKFDEGLPILASAEGFLERVHLSAIACLFQHGCHPQYR